MTKSSDCNMLVQLGGRKTVMFLRNDMFGGWVAHIFKDSRPFLPPAFILV